MCDFIEETAAKLWRYCVRHMVEKEMKKDQYYRSRDEVFSLGG